MKVEKNIQNIIKNRCWASVWSFLGLNLMYAMSKLDISFVCNPPAIHCSVKNSTLGSYKVFSAQPWLQEGSNRRLYTEGGIFDATVYRGGLQTKFISSVDIAYIKFRPKNDQTEAQYLFLIIFCILFSTFKKPADPNSKTN